MAKTPDNPPTHSLPIITPPIVGRLSNPDSAHEVEAIRKAMEECADHYSALPVPLDEFDHAYELARLHRAAHIALCRKGHER